jgi:beta-glucuronidase
VEEGLYEYAGSGWYAYQLTIPTVSEGNRYWLEFGAVYHDAWVYVNGILAGEHLHSGYTTFTIEITDHIKAGDNQIVVHADNSFSEEMLPCKRSFDWANDGGSAVWGLDLMLDIRSSAPSSEQSDWKVKWRLYSAGNTEPAAGGEASAGAGENQIERQILDNITYWHFDAPVLYMLELELCCGDVVQDTCKMRLGFRKIAVCAERLFLNGESVRLCGTEWMPGSDPQYGMAEPTEQLHKMLGILKRTNCVYTRFHWQQSEEVYEWCDENGMLVQEEIPFWGPDPEAAGETRRGRDSTA